MTYSINSMSRNHLIGLALVTGVVALSLSAMIAYIFRRSVWSKPDSSTSTSFTAALAISLEKVKEENLAMVKAGSWNGISLRTGAELAGATQSIKIELPQGKMTPSHPTQFQVVKQDTLSAAQSLATRGNKVAIVNFASHIEPGGGFQEARAGSQEEDLAYCAPELGAFFIDQVDKFTSDLQEHLFYPLKPENGYSPRDHLLHSPDVWICREKRPHGYPLLNSPFQVGVITAAASYQPELSVQNGAAAYASPIDKSYMHRCITTQLKTALDNGYDAIVLGAFGCGAFKNPTDAVAQIYHDALTQQFAGAFKQVVFAILDDPRKQDHNPQGNLKPFFDRFV